MEDVEEQELAREEGAVTQRPHVVLMTHLAQVWEGETFVPTEQLIDRLVDAHPETWGELSAFGKRLTAQRLGRMLSQNYKIHTGRIERNGPRGYAYATLATAWRRFGLTPSQKPAQVAQPAEPAQERAAPIPSGKPEQPAQPEKPAPPGAHRDGKTDVTASPDAVGATSCSACAGPLDRAAVLAGATTCTACETEELQR